MFETKLIIKKHSIVNYNDFTKKFTEKSFFWVCACNTMVNDIFCIQNYCLRRLIIVF